MSSFNLVIDEGDRSASCNVQQYSRYGYITHHGLCCLYAKYDHTQLGYTVVISIWNVDALQRQSYLSWAKLYYIMSVSNKLSYLLVSIMLLSQVRVTIVFTAKFKIDNMTFTIKRQFWRTIQLKHGLNYTVRLCNKYMFILSCMFWTTLLPCKGSCSIQSSNISSSYDI